MWLFNWVDYVVCAIVGFSTLVSLMRGFIREVCSLANWGLALWVSFSFYKDLTIELKKLIHSSTACWLISFASLFLGVLLLGLLLNHLLSRLVLRAGLGGADRLLGSLFGIARGGLLVTLLLIVGRLTPFPQAPWWRNSILLPYFYPLEHWVRQSLSPVLTQNWPASDR